MKKIVVVTLIICVSLQFTACKADKKKENNKIEPIVEKTMPFSLKTAKSLIDWTAYKTTDKLGVKGQFKKVNITSGGEGNSIKEAINGAEFSIPVSSLFTKDESRDFKIKKFFFGMMENTALLSGKLFLDDATNGYADITMNGITKKLPFTYTISDKEFKLTGTLKISDWKGEKALTSLNEACNDLHKGADGVSKTWNDVALNISSTFK